MHYCLGQHVADILELSVSSCIDSAGNKEMIMLEGNMNIYEQTYRNDKDKILFQECIPLSTLVLKVRVMAGYTVEHDISCNSTYIYWLQ